MRADAGWGRASLAERGPFLPRLECCVCLLIHPCAQWRSGHSLAFFPTCSNPSVNIPHNESALSSLCALLDEFQAFQPLSAFAEPPRPLSQQRSTPPPHSPISLARAGPVTWSACESCKHRQRPGRGNASSRLRAEARASGCALSCAGQIQGQESRRPERGLDLSSACTLLARGLRNGHLRPDQDQGRAGCTSRSSAPFQIGRRPGELRCRSSSADLNKIPNCCAAAIPLPVPARSTSLLSVLIAMHAAAGPHSRPLVSTGPKQAPTSAWPAQ
jgi:hypothetical protein